jgi:hypothetical protein
MPRVPLLANDHITVYASPDPLRIYAYTPGLVRLVMDHWRKRRWPGFETPPDVEREGSRRGDQSINPV